MFYIVDKGEWFLGKETQTQTYKNFVVYLKALACILITNSHCRDIYPAYFLAVGGTFGNSLFFVLSGYCLANIKEPFFPWYKKRLKRIGISTLIAITVCVFLTDGLSACLQRGVKGTLCFYVNKYWFAFGIALCYIFFYFIFHRADIAHVKKALLIYAVIYGIWYCMHADRAYFWIEPCAFFPFKVYFYFGIMMLGAYLRLIMQGGGGADFNRRKHQLALLCSSIVFSVILWAAVYVIVTVLQMGFTLQFLIHICVAFFAVSALRLGIMLESEFMPGNHRAIDPVISCIAESTWEIYLVQITFLKFVVALQFPVNWFLFWIIAIFGGILSHRFIKKVTR